MKSFKDVSFLIVNFIMVLFFAQCKSGYQFEENSAIQFGEPYYQTWVAGVEGGGSGINLYIPITSKPENIKLDSVYFRGKKSAIELSGNNLFVGRFKSIAFQKKDLVMSNEPFGEYGNEVPDIPEKIPFNLKDDECIISFTENNKLKFIKISGIIKKEPIYYPSAPPRN